MESGMLKRSIPCKVEDGKITIEIKTPYQYAWPNGPLYGRYPAPQRRKTELEKQLEKAFNRI